MIKNVEMLCRMAIHMKGVREINTMRGIPHAYDGACCMMATLLRDGWTHRFGMDGADVHGLSMPSSDSSGGKAMEWFGVSDDEWGDVIYCTSKRYPAMLKGEPERVSGPGSWYFDEIVMLLKRHDQLDTLMAMMQHPYTDDYRLFADLEQARMHHELDRRARMVRPFAEMHEELMRRPVPEPRFEVRHHFDIQPLPLQALVINAEAEPEEKERDAVAA